MSGQSEERERLVRVNIGEKVPLPGYLRTTVMPCFTRLEAISRTHYYRSEPTAWEAEKMCESARLEAEFIAEELEKIDIDADALTSAMDAYQDRAWETAVYPWVGQNAVYPALGLASEAGEVVGHIKKVMRDHSGVVTPDRMKALEAELGDVLWYVATLAQELRLSLGEIAAKNLAKLGDRKRRGAIRGDGDNR